MSERRYYNVLSGSKLLEYETQWAFNDIDNRLKSAQARLDALECETADTPEDVSTSKSRPDEPEFPENPDTSRAECPPTGDEPHTECMVSAQDVEEMGAERLRDEVEK